MKIVVIGGVAAGMSAASKAKRTDPSARVVVFEAGPTVSYAACGLPYFVSGLNDDPDKLIARSIEEFTRQGIEVLVRHRVQRVDADNKRVRVQNTATGQEWDEDYDRLMIASGSQAIRPDLPGVDLPGVYVLKTLEDALALKEAAKTARRVAVAGGGYIGVEVAETLRANGVQVCLAEAAPHVMGGFDPEIREMLHQRMVDNGIRVQVDAPVLEIMADEGGRACGVRTPAGTCPADLVVLAFGVRPVTGFLQDSGVRLAKNGAVLVDRHQRTNLPDVYAAGDCALAWNRAQEDFVYSPLGTVANKCGRVAGENLAGGSAQFPGCLGSAAILVCGLQAGRTGLSEAAARQKYGDDVSVSFIKDVDHPGYYPGAETLYVKLICQKSTGLILGGQTAGQRGAALRCQALALGITAGATAQQLGFADLGYAPPFGKAWDALNIAGNAIK